MSELTLVYCLYEAVNHAYPNHPEDPKRVIYIAHALQSLFNNALLLDITDQIDPLPSNHKALLTVHTPSYINNLQTLCSLVAQTNQPKAIRDEDDPDGPTFITPSTWNDVLIAAGAAVTITDRVLSTTTPLSGFSICRPPGHHATADEYMGFCFVNNVAVAAHHAQQHHGLERILILDFDVHSGNGTQDIFYNDPLVLFIDIHQVDVWPGTGKIDEIGVDAGEGFTINIPLPPYSGHNAVVKTMQEVVIPAARRFKPQLILVSAGFDGHIDDPLENLQYQTGTYYSLATMIQTLAGELCGGKCVFVLEGGYNVDAVAESAVEVVRGSVGLPSLHRINNDIDTVEGGVEEPVAEVEVVIQQIKRLHNLI